LLLASRAPIFQRKVHRHFLWVFDFLPFLFPSRSRALFPFPPSYVLFVRIFVFSLQAFSFGVDSRFFVPASNAGIEQPALSFLLPHVLLPGPHSFCMMQLYLLFTIAVCLPPLLGCFCPGPALDESLTCLDRAIPC